MAKRIYNKLVRDNIPAIIKAEGKIPVTRKLARKEFQSALKQKLLEEAEELVKAKNREEVVEELADIQEVMLSMYDSFEIKCSDVTSLGRKKRKVRGGFGNKLFLKEVR